MRENKLVFLISGMLSCAFFGLLFIQNSLSRSIFSGLFTSMIITSIIALTNFIILRHKELQSLYLLARQLKYFNDKIIVDFKEVIRSKDISLLNKFLDKLDQFYDRANIVLHHLIILQGQYLNKNFRNILAIAHSTLFLKSYFYKEIYRIKKFFLRNFYVEDIQENFTMFRSYIYEKRYFDIIRKLLFVRKKRLVSMPLDILDILRLEIKIENKYCNFDDGYLKSLLDLYDEECSNPHHDISTKFKVSNTFIKKYELSEIRFNEYGKLK